ncbi:MAG: glycerophosphodiester phosphodiesterase [Actinobacteria bacterium]|nr:glycerophosphodiester phosphodiesterase [Actinomycetota bacterium]
MPVRITPFRSPPLLFAHRGGRAHAPENSLGAFRMAVELGATGLESDVWITADGVPVLDHNGRVGRGFRRSPISSHQRVDLPDNIPSLADLFKSVPAVADGSVHLCLDLKDPEAAAPVVEVVAGWGRCSELWLAHPDRALLAGWRHLDAQVHLVDSTRTDNMPDGPERRAVDLAGAGVDAINLHAAEWSGGLCALFHRFGIECLGWDAQQPRQIAALLEQGIDGIFGDHVDRLVSAALQTPGRPRSAPA